MAGARPRGIRFDISLIILLGALNGVALTAVAIVSVGALTEDDGVARKKREAAQAIATAHARLLESAVAGRTPPLEEIRAALLTARAQMDESGAPGRVSRNALGAYRDAIELRAPTSTRTGDLGGVLETHAALIGSIYAWPERQVPDWVRTLTPLFPWAIAWVIALTLISLVEAYRLRARLSRPLEAVTVAAAQVSAGDLTVDMPEVGGETEIADLARSVRVMRDRLLDLVTRTEHRRQEVETMLGALADGVLLVDAEGRIRELNQGAERLGAELAAERLGVGAALSRALPELPRD